MIAVGMYRTNRLVEQFAGSTFGHIPFLHQKTGSSQKTASLYILLLICNPVKRFGRSIRQMLEEIHASQLGYFDIPDIFYPNVGYLRIKRFNRLKHPRQNFTFANVLFPQSLCQVMILLIIFGNHLDTRQFHSEIEFINQPFLTHTLGHSPVHRETELCLDIF